MRRSGVIFDDYSLSGLAARNNAAWCHAVCAAHDLPGRMDDRLWASGVRTPTLYPDAVTLDPRTTAEEVLHAVDTRSPGGAVKDSFATLDLAGAGFEVLFEARWIHRTALPEDGRRPASGLRWRVVRTAGELADWEEAWSDGESAGLFRPSLLREDVVFLAGTDGGRIVAGAVANRSGDAVGLSNVFAREDEYLDGAWAGSTAQVARLWPDLPIVGYEAGDDLDAAVRNGFSPVGPLRVWLHAGGVGGEDGPV
ncbi:hypothetical protein [Streptomyces sp. NPDC012888]|uniref:hypothetical protein n=1 Tax=Streptomyces sp. NPDC012888 TaxID=3364855 RepID=UPI00369EFA26